MLTEKNAVLLSKAIVKMMDGLGYLINKLGLDLCNTTITLRFFTDEKGKFVGDFKVISDDPTCDLDPKDPKNHLLLYDNSTIDPQQN